MYLEYFGLNEPPFKITPVTDFFFPGANRAEILDALLYAISESEGIIKVTGEVGSGKTMLCRMLLEKFPERIEAVYLANPSLSREEMLHAIADGLSLNLDGQRVNIILQTLQNHLELKVAQGKRVVILVDEAHAMPLDTMEELRLLYNLQVGNNKLLHIVLFGQPELNTKLNQPNMRQLKDRIIHHFSMLPLSQNIIESYLLFRLRTAGYRGPSPFSQSAAILIGKASQGLMRRVNILADKAMLAAFVENTHGVDVRHVQAAIKDTEMSELSPAWWKRKSVIFSALVLLSILSISSLTWLLGGLLTRTTPNPPPASTPAPAANSSYNPPQETPEVKLLLASSLNNTPQSTPSASATSQSAAEAPPHEASRIQQATPSQSPATPGTATPLLDQRLTAARETLYGRPTGSVSIQLYYTDNVKPTRIEAFLRRAQDQQVLHNIYVVPIKINGRKGYRVLFGVYPGSDQARTGMKQLPKRFREGFAPTIYLLEDLEMT